MRGKQASTREVPIHQLRYFQQLISFFFILWMGPRTCTSRGISYWKSPTDRALSWYFIRLLGSFRLSLLETLATFSRSLRARSNVASVSKRSSLKLPSSRKKYHSSARSVGDLNYRKNKTMKSQRQLFSILLGSSQIYWFPLCILEKKCLQKEETPLYSSPSTIPSTICTYFDRWHIERKKIFWMFHELATQSAVAFLCSWHRQ